MWRDDTLLLDIPLTSGDWHKNDGAAP